MDFYGLSCIYDSYTGRLQCYTNVNGTYKKTVDAYGYSGRGEGKNNPRLQDVRDVGPIPEGFWTMKSVQQTPTQVSIWLEPYPGSPVFNFDRDPMSFLIHGDYKDPKKKGKASKGCPIFDKEYRDKIAEQLGETFIVISSQPSQTWQDLIGIGKTN